MHGHYHSLILSESKMFYVSFSSCFNMNHLSLSGDILFTWEDNRVRELAIACLPWQHWTKTLVCFDDVDISAFHSCVVVDLWQSLSEWRLLLSACVLVCLRENVGA